MSQSIQEVPDENSQSDIHQSCSFVFENDQVEVEEEKKEQRDFSKSKYPGVQSSVMQYDVSPKFAD